MCHKGIIDPQLYTSDKLLAPDIGFTADPVVDQSKKDDSRKILKQKISELLNHPKIKQMRQSETANHDTRHSSTDSHDFNLERPSSAQKAQPQTNEARLVRDAA